MLKIAKSLVVVFAFATMAVGATQAVFTSQAKVTGNTFATGVLEIRINGQTSTTGFNMTNAAPGTEKTGQFTLMNYGAPWFAGPSTLSAKALTLSAVQTTGSSYLYNGLEITITKDAGGSPETIYTGPLSGFSMQDALVSYYHSAGLVPGNSETIKYSVSLPASADNSYMGLSTTFDFVADAASN
ncbi:MAG: hypothetical protein WCW17_03800 [Patescibacteria group bacterium]|jgi:hypothetical protein